MKQRRDIEKTSTFQKIIGHCIAVYDQLKLQQQDPEKLRKQKREAENYVAVNKVLIPFIPGGLLLIGLIIWTGIRSQEYEFVSRGNTSGIPPSMLYLSLFVAVIYFLGMWRLVSPRLKEYRMTHREHWGTSRKFLYFTMFFFSLPAVICTWTVVPLLNGYLDSSPSQTRPVKATKKVMLSVTPYYLAKDWKNPDGWVYFMAHDEFVKAHPFGSTFTITTKSGWLGYEWYVSGYSVFSQQHDQR